jgi:hypothetical protein
MNERPIEHEEAVKNMMAERYLLGELNASQRDAYEEHLFSCDACFEQVKAGTEFVGHLRRIGTDELASDAPGFMAMVMKGLFQPGMAVVGALLICVSAFSVYQHRTIAGLRQTQVAPSFFLSDGAKAGGIKQVVLPRNSRFELSIQLLQTGDFAAYEGQILTDAGQVKSSFPISAEQTRDTIHIVLESGGLGSGSYFVKINGITPEGRRQEITRYSFQLLVKE